MKNIKNCKRNIIILMVCLASISCNKFEILKDIDPELVEAGVNLRDKTIWDFISERSDSKAIDTLKSLNLYATAIERVGLRPLLESEGNYTVIAPRNEAMKTLALSLGYQNVDDVPAVLLKNIFLNNMISERVKSFDLDANKVKLYKTLNEDSISFARQPSSTNLYVFNLYNAPSLSTSTVSVRSQNLDCKNGVVHVVDEIKSYRPKFLQPEAAKLSGDTIYVTKDAYMNNGSTANKRNNFGDLQYMWIKKNNNADLSRRAIMQFPVRNSTKFTGNIAGVTLYMHTNRFDTPPGGNSAVLSIYEDQNVNFNEIRTDPNNTDSGINWLNAPTPGTVEISNINFVGQLRTDTIVSASISNNYKAALAGNKTFINIGLNCTANALFQILTKETLDANLLPNKYRAFLVLTPEQITVLVNPINTGLTVDLKNGYKKITTNELRFSGTDNRNITYTLTSKPTQGYVVVEGKSNITIFTQAQIEAGAVKYLYAGNSAGTDSFTVTAKDSEGNSFPNPQIVNITIQ